MKIYQGIEAAGEIKNAVVTTGSFDGVHIGHKTILNRLHDIAAGIGGESVLITFHPHPRKVLYPETAGRNLFLINSQEEKIELLRKTRLDHLVIIKFTPEFAHMSSIDFIRKILVGRLKARKVIVGFNHHFGHNQEGDYEILSELGKYYGFEVEEIPQQDIENETVSSTRIRKALIEGKIQRANAYLDHYYMIMGKVHLLAGQVRAMKLPSYLVEITEECKLIPPPGVYAVSLLLNQQQIKAMAIVANIPGQIHSNRQGLSVEIIPFDPELSLDQIRLSINFHKMMRELEGNDTADLSDGRIIQDTMNIEELIY